MINLSENIPLIRLKNVSKVFANGQVIVKALDNINLEIKKGEFAAIVGASGSGKTTLIDILGCLSKPTSGIYYLEGIDVTSLDEKQLSSIINKKIGLVFQSFHLLPRYTALDNVILPLLYTKSKRKEREESAKEVLASVGLSDRLHHFPNQLSGGQQQRVAIARALVNKPSLILADEPTGNLDTKSGEEIISLLSELHRKGNTIILITHNTDLTKITNKIITIRDGNIANILEKA